MAFPLTTAHVQTCVQFALRHNLCISVLGTGHDYVNRHSCDGGILIRTTLLKGAEYQASQEQLQFGSGTVFSEAHHFAAQHGQFVSSGWGTSVGIAGWSLGGGHGPWAPGAGLGVDNVVSLEVVTANGTVVTADANQNADLWWAMRGGGGSTWGVVTTFTLKAHSIPSGGFQMHTLVWEGDFCSSGTSQLEYNIDGFLS